MKKLLFKITEKQETINAEKNSFEPLNPEAMKQIKGGTGTADGGDPDEGEYIWSKP